MGEVVNEYLYMGLFDVSEWCSIIAVSKDGT